ncbi:hypothetical protein [Amycolatopsis tolypomycina]|uniref:hypothetical protein n=1 Tax=Amycolatopsis tolypomycina TaxID=208445 RepID=UPI00142E58CB|nr:hypothetical protein [Amycolatopsis tolypomycina]
MVASNAPNVAFGASNAPNATLGRRPTIGDAGSDLRHYEPRVRGEDRRAPREDDVS